MKKIFSIIFPALLLMSGIAFAFTTTDDPICSQEDHTGYRYSNTGTPPLPFNPAAPLPSGLTNEGQYGTDFDCSEEPTDICHWVYVPANGSNPAQWVACEDGGFKPLN